MNNKTKVIIAVSAILVSFASGRFLTPTKVVTVVKTVEVEKKTSASDKKTHKETTIVESTKPDGTKETTTKIVEVDDTKKHSTDDITKQSESTSTVTKGGSRLSVSALAGVSLSNFSGGPIYGASVSRELLGPISLGVWGLNNSTAGISLGLSF